MRESSGNLHKIVRWQFGWKYDGSDARNTGSRQYVHLSQDEQTALTVGQRHGKPVVLKIKALLMHEQDFKFYQAENGVWLTPNVPAAFILE